MVAGQSCIASPAVFCHLVPLSTHLCTTPSLCQYRRTRYLQPPSVGGQGLKGWYIHVNQHTKMSRMSRGVCRLRLHYCLATYRFFHVTLAARTEQAFLCSQGHFCLDIYGVQLPWTLLDSFSTCVGGVARLYVQ